MNILDQIILHKQAEVNERKNQLNLRELEKMPSFKQEPLPLGRFLLDSHKTGIIAEFKRKSPSKGVINAEAKVEDVTRDYAKYGASALSVLTDEEFFGGTMEDFLVAREVQLPLLRKDFIIDEFQIVESKAYGADIILLIAAALKNKLLTRELAIFARNTGLQVLLEIHGEEELEHICDEVDFVGVNNRNLKTFAVDIENSISLSKAIPADKLKIAESGIHSLQTLQLLRQEGFNGFLMGEKFMHEPDPGKAFKQFVMETETVSKN